MTAMNRVGRLTLACALILCMASMASAQTTWYVDDDGVNDPGPGDVTVSDPNEDGSLAHPFDAIQEAIDVAVAGDEVIVADGTYTGAGNKSIDFGGKDLILRSASGAADCVIDCENADRGFRFHSGESSAAVVDGFTIASGYLNWGRGGAIKCQSSSHPTIQNCIMTDCRADYDGGCVYTVDSNPSFINCVMSNSTVGQSGGALHDDGGGALCINCLIVGNEAGGDGGGVFCTGSVAMFVNCTIAGNVAGDAGGGAQIQTTSDIVIDNTIIAGNTATNGADISLVGASNPSTLTISYSCVLGGEAAVRVLSGCTLTWGDGMIGDDPLFQNATGEDYHLLPGSLCIDGGTNAPTVGLLDYDLEGNLRAIDGDGDIEPWTGVAATADMGVYETGLSTDPFICVTPTELMFEADQNGANPAEQVLSIHNCGVGTLNWQIIEDCSWLSVDPNGGASTGEVDDVAVSVDVSGLAGGEYSCVLEIVDTQVATASRYVTVELTVNPPLICVTPETLVFTADPGGANPADQTFAISNCGVDVLNWEVIEDCSWLSVSPASGSSSGESDDVTVSVDITGLEERAYSFTLEVTEAIAPNSPQYVQVFLGVGEYLHVPGMYPTIQDAIDAAGPGMTVLLADGTYTGVGNRDLDFGGKDITLRSANGPDNCIINCDRDGRGFYFHSYETEAATVQGVTVRRGYHESYLGGGVWCEHSSPTFIDCVFSANSGSRGGVLACTANGAPRFFGCLFQTNSAWQEGGVAYCLGNSAPIFCGCEFYDNAVEGDEGANGGAICCKFASSAVVTQCVFAYNSVFAGGTIYPFEYGHGGAVSVYGDAEVNTVNCTYYRNTVTDDAGYQRAEPIWRASGTYGADYNQIVYPGGGANPLFVDAANYDFRLQAGSPFIDAGDNTAVPLDTYDLDGNGDTTERLPVDFDGMLRLVDLQGTIDTGVADPPDYPYVVDMGAYEYQCTGDLDGDGAINLADLQLLLSSYGDTDATYVGGDLDGSGTVDLSDLQMLLSAYGQICQEV